MALRVTSDLYTHELPVELLKIEHEAEGRVVLSLLAHAYMTREARVFTRSAHGKQRERWQTMVITSGQSPTSISNLVAYITCAQY